MGLNLTELTDFLPAFAVTLGKTGAKEAKNVSKKAIQRALPGKVSSSIIERAALYMGIQGPVFFGILHRNGATNSSPPKCYPHPKLPILSRFTL
jgi:hypothetical protein